MKDIDYNEVFGISEGANESELADQTTEDSDTELSAKEPDVATQDEIEDNEGEEDLTNEEYSEADEEPEGQSDEDNTKFAELRRKMQKQQEEAVNEAKRQAEENLKARLDEKIKALNLIDPYTNEAITTEEEYESYKNRRSEDAVNSVKERAGLTDERFKEFIDELPEVREARAKLKEAQAINEDIKRMRMEETVKNQLEEIGKMNPAIKGMDDILKMDNYKTFESHVKKGLSFVDAYKLANFDQLTDYRIEAGKQSARNAQAGKNHLSKTSQRGKSGAVEVPADVMDYYKLFNPEMSESDIRKHYENTF